LARTTSLEFLKEGNVRNPLAIPVKVLTRALRSFGTLRLISLSHRLAIEDSYQPNLLFLGKCPVLKVNATIQEGLENARAGLWRTKKVQQLLEIGAKGGKRIQAIGCIFRRVGRVGNVAQA